MSSSHNLEKHARNEDSKLPRWLKIILTFIVLYFLWSSLPKVEVANEPMLMTDRELLEKVHELTSIEPLPSSYNSREKLLARFGKKLFFDKRLSLNNQVACSTCHDPEFSFSENKAQSTGLGLVSRNTPPIINLAQSSWFFWDGRADSLASQALGPLFHPKEMGLTPASFAKKIGLHHKKEYEALFGKFPKVIASLSNDHKFRLGEQDVMTLEMAAYGLATVSSFSVLDNILSDSSQKHMAPASLLAELSSGRSLDFKSHKPLDPKKQKDKIEVWTKKSNALEKVLLNTALSLEKFQKGLVANESPFDRFLRLLIDTRDVANSLHEEFKEEELDGLKIFLGQGKCSLCHNGNNLTDQGFHNIGLAFNDSSDLMELPVGRSQGVLDVISSKYNCNSKTLKKFRKKLNTHNDSEGCKEFNYLDTENLELMGSFKTPTLRNVELTAPYMHDGRFESLEDVIDHYDTLDERPSIGHMEESLKPLNLSEARKKKLIAFLKSLTSEITDLSE